MNEPDIMWEGASGRKYGYWSSSLYASWKEVPGNYIYVKETSLGSGQWTPLYIGQTANLNQGLAGYEKEAEVIRRGATHVHTHISSPEEQERLAEERDLVAKLRPPCNERLYERT